VIYACVGMISVQETLIDIALLIKETSGKSTYVLQSLRCNNRAVLCSENNYVNHNTEKFLTVAMGKLK
jgi:hypothetical protein